MQALILSRVNPPCGYCDKAKALLEKHEVPFTEIDITAHESTTQLFKAFGYSSVPVILIDGTPIGGYTELLSILGE